MGVSGFMCEVAERLNTIEPNFINQETERKMSEINEVKQVENQKAILAKVESIEERAIIRVLSLDKSDISIDKTRLSEEMERSMVLYSHVIEDIFTLKLVLEEIKVILNGVVGNLHHNLKFKNQYNLKTTKDLETHIAKDQLYNLINVKIKRIQSLIEKGDNYSNLLKQKIGFIRDLTKMRTQEMFGESASG